MNHRHLRPTPAPSRVVTPFHRGPSAQPVANSGAVHTAAPNAAMLIDFDNVTMGIRSDLQAELKNLLSSDIIKGKVAVRRAYADWRRYPQYIVPLTESSIDLIFAPAYGSSKKNATDIRLAIDALELVFTRPEIGTFVLLSGDSDFSSMVIKLKEYGKYVIGVGIRESSSDLLVMNCDEYYSYNALAGLVKTGDDESTRWDPWDLVTEAVSRMKRNGDVMRSDRLKQVMQEIDSSFDEKNLGMSKFSRFVQDAAHKGLLKTTKLDNGQLEVDVPASVPVSASAPATPVGEAAAVPAVDPEERARERPDRDRDDRRGRRGRRGRGRDRDREPRDMEGAAEPTVTGEHDVEDSPAAPSSDVASVATGFAATAPVPGIAPAAIERTPEIVNAAAPSFGEMVSESIGRAGERLTRGEAFDLVKRSVESLVQGEDTTSASAVRKRAYELLGRDSESLSARNFERILRDAHDVDMIDLRRRGNDFEVARAAAAAPIVDQLKTAEQVHKAAAAANAPPPPPRGMVPRGVGGRAKAGRGAAVPSADLLMVGVVGGTKPATVTEVVATEPALLSSNGAEELVASAATVPAPGREAPAEVETVAKRGRKPSAAKSGKSVAKESKAPAKASKPQAKSTDKSAGKSVDAKAAPARKATAAKKAARNGKK